MICLISISFVCANENLTNKTDYLNNQDMNSEIILSSNEGNFTELSQLISNTDSSLELDKDYKHVSGDDVANTGIVISKNMIINGNGHTIDASNLGRIFSVSGSNVILKNITLINGKFSGYGGAVYVSGANFTLDNCKLEDNYANYGGAIYSTGINTKITNSELKDNTAQYSGGAIRTTNSNLVIDNSNFTDNKIIVHSTYYGGGAVYSTGSHISISNSKFENNSAQSYAGGVYISGSYSTIDNTTFINNTGIDSAALYMESSYSSVNNSRFYNNTATEYDGGAIGWYGNYGKLTNSYFENNSANNHGGGVFWHYNYGTLDNLTFVNNHAANGAGISIMSTNYMDDNSYSHNVISNCEFTNNTALYGGGGVDASSHTKIFNSTFTSNKVGSYGGAVTLTNAELINATLTDNTALYGGAVYTYNSTIENSTFKGNSAPNGNSVYILDKSTLNNNKNLDESDITVYNSGEERGDVIDNSYNIDNLITTTNGYLSYCAERYNTNPYSGVFDNRLELLRNSINHQPVGDYLKILVYYYVDNFEDLRKYDFANYVWAFTDYEYWNSADPVVKEVVRLYDSGLRVSTENGCKVLPNGTLMYFNFTSLVTPSGQQNLFLFKFWNEDVINETLTKEALINKTVYLGDTVEYRIVINNKGSSPVYDNWVEDNDYSEGLVYKTWRAEVGNWTYNEINGRWHLDVLQPGQSASIILTFGVTMEGLLSNNATSGLGVTDVSSSSAGFKAYNPNMTVEKKTLTPQVELGNQTIFEIIVRNTGDIDLDNVFVYESEYGSGLVYVDFSSKVGTWKHSLEGGKHKFTLDGLLEIDDSASFRVIFKTTRTGNFSNTVTAGFNDTVVSNSTNTTEVSGNNTTNDDNETTEDTTKDNKTTDVSEENESDDKHNAILKKEIDEKATGNPLFLLLLTLILLPLCRKFKI